MKRSRITQPAFAGPDREFMFSLINGARAVEQRLEQALATVGLSMAKFGALTHLVEAGEALTLGECAARMTCVPSNITQLMDRLQTEGLVTRVVDPNDRRAVRAKPTPLGVQLQAAGAKEVAKVQKELAATMKGVDRGALQRALGAIK
jgi:MarR family transcriptional regulator, transcriptional regulator for hemolysin